MLFVHFGGTLVDCVGLYLGYLQMRKWIIESRLREIPIQTLFLVLKDFICNCSYTIIYIMSVKEEIVISLLFCDRLLRILIESSFQR